MIINGTSHLSMNEFNDAFLAAKPGQAVIYATGDLAFDRSKSPELGGVGGMAWHLHERGEACLTQRRLPDSKFAYLATKRGGHDASV